MKHSKRMKWPTDKLHSKVNELIFQGSTCLRMKVFQDFKITFAFCLMEITTQLNGTIYHVTVY